MSDPYPWRWYVRVSWHQPMTEQQIEDFPRGEGHQRYLHYFGPEQLVELCFYFEAHEADTGSDAAHRALHMTPEASDKDDFTINVHRTTEAEHASNRRAMESLGFVFGEDGKPVEPQKVPI